MCHCSTQLQDILAALTHCMTSSHVAHCSLACLSASERHVSAFSGGYTEIQQAVPHFRLFEDCHATESTALCHALQLNHVVPG